MEELKILIDAVSNMPKLAIWVVAMYFLFKISIVGSVYGVIRFVTQKLHDVLVKKKEPNVVQNNVTVTLDDKVVISTSSESNVRDADVLDLFDAIIKYGGHSYVFRQDLKEVIELIKENTK